VVRVAGITALGEPVETIDVPGPHPLAHDEVLIDVRAAGVANWDEITRRGEWELGAAPPMALGVEAAGVIAAVGEAVDGWSAGDEVLTHPLPLRAQGTWAPRLIAPAALLARKPTGVPWDVAAAFPVPALTAEQVLGEALELEHGGTLLVHGAGGVTGGLLVALGAIRGAEVIAAAGPSSHQRLNALGAAHLLDYHDQSWPEEAKGIAGGAGVDAAVNSVPRGATVAIAAVRDGGCLATITSDPPDAQRGIAVSTVSVRPDGAALERLAELLADGRLSIDVGYTFPLEQAATALETALHGTAGRAVVVVP
jgi:NADPH:quinone reductase-like Zn-dependent oxidoreductase